MKIWSFCCRWQLLLRLSRWVCLEPHPTACVTLLHLAAILVGSVPSSHLALQCRSRTAQGPASSARKPFEPRERRHSSCPPPSARSQAAAYPAARCLPKRWRAAGRSRSGDWGSPAAAARASLPTLATSSQCPPCRPQAHNRSSEHRGNKRKAPRCAGRANETVAPPLWGSLW